MLVDLIGYAVAVLIIVAMFLAGAGTLHHWMMSDFDAHHLRDPDE